ncbi:penicillin-binding protein activator [Idiomarina seosinensis]|uniref:penicillin-binding protein activator n=1 Tax=Idiomarina seosinensis TaxID=281739 RepID=UPI00385160F2
MKSRSMNTLKGLAVALFSVLALTQCSSVEQKSTARQTEPDTTSQPQPEKDAERPASDWLQQAADASTPEQQYSLLIKAALAFQRQQQWQQSAAVLSQLQAQSVPADDYPLLALVNGQWLAHNQQWPAVISTLQPITSRFTEREHRLLALQLLAKSHARLKQFWQAGLAEIEATPFSRQHSDRQRQRIWRYLQYVAPEQLPRERPASEKVAGWWRLLEMLHNEKLTPAQLRRQLQQWQSSYPDHLGNTLVSEWAGQDWQAPRLIAALLPLSGRYQAQGYAVRDGLLAASAQLGFSIQFIDTNAVPLEQQQRQILENGATHIVGPLLKEQVEAWLQKPLLGPYQLLLNEVPLLSPTIQTGRQVQFALSGEDEVKQTARRLARDAEYPPIIFAQQNAAGENLVSNFNAVWQQLRSDEPELGWYSAREDMQVAVEQRLGISASKQRIREVKIAAGKIIIDEQERSRSDIDTAYLPGDLQKVRLLKPFVDVNLSPAAPELTVFANSGVHQRSNRNGDADLEGVVFSEAPALIGEPDNELNAWLQVRSNASLSDGRLFAMGYDSAFLLPQLPVLNILPGAHWVGYNGQLSVTFYRIQRQLDWAIFDVNQVQPVD